MHVLLSVKCLALMMLVSFALESGAIPCQDSLDCARMNLRGYICLESRCVCDPNTERGLFPCRGRMFGDTCRSDYECAPEMNLVCSRSTLWTCQCRRGFVWNMLHKNCYMDELTYDNGNKGFDPVRDVIVLGFVLMAIGAFVYMGIKVFCSCGKFWKRQQRHLTRELEEVPHQQQDTWVASYRGETIYETLSTTAHDKKRSSPFRDLDLVLFSSLNGMETCSSPVLSPSSSFPLHPTPCMGLFLPSGPLAAAASTTTSTMSPPPYEEALKHKVILSSYPSATTVILPPAPPTQGPHNNLPGGNFMCNSQGGPN